MSEQLNLPATIAGFLTGAPYSGKSHLLRAVEQLYGVRRIEASDALRGCTRAQEAEAFMKEGKIVPVEIVSLAISEAVEHLGSSTSAALLVGYPRDYAQALTILPLGRPVFLLDTPMRICSLRAHKRVSEKQNGKGDDDSLRAGRHDEDPEVIARRFGEFVFKTLAGIEACDQAGLLERLDGGLDSTVLAEKVADRLRLKLLAPTE